MKVSKKQLRRIIREEKSRLLSEQPISGAQADQMAAAQKAANDVKKQADMMAELDNIAVGIEGVAKEMYGLANLDDMNLPQGDDLARTLEIHIEALNVFYEQMEAYFTAITPE
jgi:hypothetical protein